MKNRSSFSGVLCRDGVNEWHAIGGKCTSMRPPPLPVLGARHSGEIWQAVHRNNTIRRHRAHRRERVSQIDTDRDVVLVLAAGWLTDYIGIYSVFGGFIAGMAMPKVPGFVPLLNARTMQVTRCLFLPVFFAGLDPGSWARCHFGCVASARVVDGVAAWAFS